MKLICIIGSSVQKTLLPLLHYQEQFSSVLFLASPKDLETVEFVRDFLGRRMENSAQRCSFRTEILPNSPDYDDFYEQLSAILWESFAEDEQTVLNVSGGSAKMILAGMQAAKAMRIPVMYVDSNKLNIQLIEWAEDGIHTNIRRDYVDMSAFNVRDFLALCNFYPDYLIPDETLPGIQYERWIYSFFQSGLENGDFDSIDRNIILTWNRNMNKMNEIDIVFIRNRTLGFISVKSGRSVDIKPNFQKTSRELKSIYPEWLLKLPCLRILISKHGISTGNKNILKDKGILVFDDVVNGEDVQRAIRVIIAEADRFTASLPHPKEEILEQFSEQSDGIDAF